MRCWTFCKLLAALAVIAVMIFNGMLAYHVRVAPLGGIFAQIIPTPAPPPTTQAATAANKILDPGEAPGLDPGEQAFQQAHELLAIGQLAAARDKLTTIIKIFPASPSAPAARRIVGEMNLDEILSSAHMTGKQIHVVKRGDSFLAIAAQHQTTVDCLMHLNSMMELRNIQPGEELVVMPLELRLLIEPQRKTLSLWDGPRFIQEYPILHLSSTANAAQKTTISSKFAELGGHRITPPAKEYRSADKLIQIAKNSVVLRGWDGTGPRPTGGVLLQPQDLEEINLLTRVGNAVEIR